MIHTLKLFRRHDSNCAGSDGNGNCTISAEGRLLKTKLYVRPKSTGQREWDEARKVADQWGEWGGTTQPNVVVPVEAGPVRIPVVESIQRFLKGLSEENQVRI